MDSTCITEYGYNGSVSQPVSQSFSLSLTDRKTSARQSVCPSILDRQTDFYKWLISLQKIQKNIRKMVSTYITECGSKELASQPVSQPVTRSVCIWQRDWLQPASQSVSLSVLDRHQPAGQSDLNNIYIYMYI